MPLTNIGELETLSNDKTSEIVKALRDELMEDAYVVSRVNHTMNASAWALGNPLENRDVFHLIIRRMAHYIREELGPLNANLFLIVEKISLKRSSPEGYILSARVTYLKDKFGRITPVEDDNRFVFISKEKPELAIDLINGDSHGDLISYYALAPHDGLFRDIQPLRKSDVKDYDLSRFWAIPVKDNEDPNLKTVLEYISKK